MAVKLQNMKNSEITEQIKLFNWARSVREFVPELKLLHHIPNEGKRTNGALLKAAGMIAGVPDLSLPVARRGFNGLYIEMKFGNNKPTKDQIEFMAMLKDQGYKTAVAYSAEESGTIWHEQTISIWLIAKKPRKYSGAAKVSKQTGRRAQIVSYTRKINSRNGRKEKRQCL